MFTKELSDFIINYCDSQSLSYETASELCDISPRYFGSIVRGRTIPTLKTLEKLCKGLGKTPDELLAFPIPDEELSYRRKMKVIHYRRSTFLDGEETEFPVCPRCLDDLEREYQAFCDKCGQKLGWNDFQYATPERKGPRE